MSAVKSSTKKSAARATAAKADEALKATNEAALVTATRAITKVSDPLVVHACARSKFEHTDFGPDGNMPADAVAEYAEATDVLIRTKSHSAAGIAYKLASAMELTGEFGSSTPSPEEIYETIAEGPTTTRLLASAYLDAMTQGRARPAQRHDAWESALTTFKLADAAYDAAAKAYDESFVAVRDDRPEAPDLAREFVNGKPGNVIRLDAVDRHVRDMAPAVAEQVKSTVIAHWTAVEAIEDRHHFYEREEEQENATHARWLALNAVMETQAPDVLALAEKMRLYILDSHGVDVASKEQLQRLLSGDEKVEAKQMLAIYRDMLAIADLPDPTHGVAAFDPTGWLSDFEVTNESPFWFDDRGFFITDDQGLAKDVPTAWRELPSWKREQVHAAARTRGMAWRLAADAIKTYANGWWTPDSVDTFMAVRWEQADGDARRLAWDYIDLSGITFGDGDKHTGERRQPFDAAAVSAAFSRLPIRSTASPDGSLVWTARDYRLNQLIGLIEASWSDEQRREVRDHAAQADARVGSFLHAAE
ncbi:hypothetical protein [Caulobacter sp. NIBR2454]|uniref:hypothetical protein n=1 Tax=Caulobacter sp. NIBR2454 TaxID=3015996 RepID=UPI0022B7443B|nr:hypothetical protein [Caulobacter sp. NIBR2454]